jgi:hypothetical protein
VAALPLVTHTHQCLTPIHVGQASTAVQTACQAGWSLTGAESGVRGVPQYEVIPPSAEAELVEARPSTGSGREGTLLGRDRVRGLCLSAPIGFAQARFAGRDLLQMTLLHVAEAADVFGQRGDLHSKGVIVRGQRG